MKAINNLFAEAAEERRSAGKGRFFNCWGEMGNDLAKAIQDAKERGGYEFLMIDCLKAGEKSQVGLGLSICFEIRSLINIPFDVAE